MFSIARHELKRLFHSPLAWVLLAGQQLLLAWVYLRVIERFSGLEAAQRGAGLTQELTLNLFSFAAVLALFCAPLLTMRVISGERRDGSLALLASAPVGLAAILLGKLLGLAGMLAAFTLLPLLMSLALLPWSPLDPGLLAAATLGLALVYLLFTSIGLFTSTLSRQPAGAAAGAYGVLLLLSVVKRMELGEGAPLLNWLAWNEHLLPFLFGLVQTPNLAYFLILSGLFLALALRRLAAWRDGD